MDNNDKRLPNNLSINVQPFTFVFIHHRSSTFYGDRLIMFSDELPSCLPHHAEVNSFIS